MKMSTAYVLIGLLLGFVGGVMLFEAPLVAVLLLLPGGIMFSIGAIAKGVSLGMFEYDDYPTPKPKPATRPEPVKP